MSAIPPASERRAGFLTSISVGPTKSNWPREAQCCGCGTQGHANVASIGDPWKIKWSVCLACARKMVAALEALEDAQ